MSSSRARLLALVIVAAAACGDDQPLASDADLEPDTTLVPDVPDTIAPAIEAVTPAEGAASAWVHGRFVVTFSEPVAAATITPQTLRLVDATGAELTASTSLLSGGRTVEVRARDEVAALGTLRLDVSDAITDAAGNPLPQPATFTWQLAPWAARPGGLDVGPAPQAPALATTAHGAVLATAIGAAGARTIVVLDDDGMLLGAPLGAGVVGTPSVAATADGDVLVAWVDALSAIQAARWDGGAWIALPSPGAGSHPAVAAAPSGELAIAWAGAGTVDARRLVETTWVPAGPQVPITAVVGDLALAMPDATTVVAAFVDRAPAADQLRTLRFAGSLREEPRITLAARSPAPHVSLAARGARIAVAWDEFSGHSFGAYAALGGSGGGWTILPMLDVDPPADARAPSVALDGEDHPVVAWTEQVEGAHRGFVARWSGDAWKTVGGDAWTRPGAGAPERAALALWHDRVPVVAWHEAGAPAIEVARFNGPAVARLGLASRPSLAGCRFDVANPPATLAATGCFAIVGGTAKAHPGLVPYDLRSELWTDGALKRRWLAPPDGKGFTALANGALDAPLGSFVIKEFALGDPAARTIVETRFLVRNASGWQGRSYRWRADGSDAELLAGGGATRVTWTLPGGGAHEHVYPSTAECQRCHNASVGPLLGVRRDQLARAFDYDGVRDDQFRTFAQLGVLPHVATTPLPAPDDVRLPVERRVRGYLAANCAHCHNPSGERSAQDFRIQTPLAQTGLCNLLVPGDPNASRLYQRVTSRPGMPPLGTLQTDPVIVDLVARWISSLSSCP